MNQRPIGYTARPEEQPTPLEMTSKALTSVLGSLADLSPLDRQRVLDADPATFAALESIRASIQSKLDAQGSFRDT